MNIKIRILIYLWRLKFRFWLQSARPCHIASLSSPPIATLISLEKFWLQACNEQLYTSKNVIWNNTYFIYNVYIFLYARFSCILSTLKTCVFCTQYPYTAAYSSIMYINCAWHMYVLLSNCSILFKLGFTDNKNR